MPGALRKGSPERTQSEGNLVVEGLRIIKRIRDMNKQDISKISQGALYIALSFFLWLIVEYVTVWHAKLNDWLSLMPYILIQYFFIVFFFAYLFFRINMAENQVFIIMIIVMYIFELLWKNSLLYDPVWIVPVSLLLLSIWGFLTFIPLWFLNKSLEEHKTQVIYCLLWIPGGFILSLVM